MTSWASRKRSALIASENRLFSAEYHKHHVSYESKPLSIGRPFFLHSDGNEKGILLIHGLMAAPEEVRELGENLHGIGYNVYAPRLAGHGTSADDLSSRNRHDWLQSVRKGLAILKTCCTSVVIAGFSTGAALSLASAITMPDAFDAVISISAPYKFKKTSSRFAETLLLYNKTCKSIGIARFARPYATNHPDNPHINYTRCPVSVFVEVKKLMSWVSPRLHEIKIPCLVIQGDSDPKVSPVSGPEIFSRIGSEKKVFSWIKSDIHGIVRDYKGIEVFDKVRIFLDEYYPNK